jgi:hypothetical protein
MTLQEQNMQEFQELQYKYLDEAIELSRPFQVSTLECK